MHIQHTSRLSRAQEVFRPAYDTSTVRVTLSGHAHCHPLHGEGNETLLLPVVHMHADADPCWLSIASVTPTGECCQMHTDTHKAGEKLLRSVQLRVSSLRPAATGIIEYGRTRIDV